MLKRRAELVILGSGGLARQIQGVLGDLRRQYQFLGCLGPDDRTKADSRVIGPDSLLETLDVLWILGISDVETRARLAGHAHELDRPAARVIHPTARIEDGTVIGAGTVLMPGVHIQEGAIVADHVLSNVNSLIGHECVIAEHVALSPYAVIGARSSVGAGSTFGIGSVVIPDTKIGENVTVGAGAVVTRDVEDGQIVAGVPARPLRPPT